MTKILLVEDDKSLREIYGVRLLAEGYDIVSAGDGEEALAMAIKDRPSLIVSDVMMPKISGFDMLDILRSTTETKDIKVIMMTALSSDDQRKRGEQLGADRYLVKSQVGIEDVVRAVHEVLNDAPTTGSANVFSSTPPTPSAPPATPAAPAPSSTPASGPQPAPAGPRPAPAMTPPPRPSTATPTAVPVATDTTQTLTPAPAPTAPAPASGLPQPTAPFSTPRPGSLADRVIQPLEKPDEPGLPVAELMDKELTDEPQPNPFTATPPTETTPDVPQDKQATPSAAPPAPQPPAEPEAPSQTPQDSSSLAFEETPRPASPTQTGPFPPSTTPPQTPAA